MNALRTTSLSRLTRQQAVLLAALLLLATHAWAQSPPAGVGAITVTRGDGTLTATWKAPANAAAYHVTYTTNNGQSWSLGAMDHAPTTWTLNGADNSATYVVGVRARNSDNAWSGWQNSPAAGPYNAPSPPDAVTAVTVTRADGTLTATWNAPANAAAYHVTYTTNNGQSWSLGAGDHAPTTWTLSNADNAATYVVGVRAWNRANAWSGWRNSPASGPYTPQPDPQPPAAPAGLTATGGDGSVTVSWTDPGDSSITGYEYQYRYAGVAWSAWTAVADSGAGTTSFTLDGLTNGAEHRVKIRAVNAHGASLPAPTADPWFVAATPKAATPPDAPAPITVTRADGALTASWPPVDGATGYTIAYSAVGNGDWTTAAANHAATSITISGVNNDYSYVVGASARNAAGSSAQSVSPASGPYSSKPPLAPPSVTILRGNGTLAAFWNSGYGAESYQVAYTSDDGNTWTTAADRHPVGNGTTEIDIGGLDNAKTYTVRVRARNKNGYSEWRHSRPSGPYVPLNPPPKPKNVKVYPSDKAITFIWDKPVDLKGQNTEVTGYQAAYWEISGDCAWPATVRWYNVYGSDADTVYHTIPGLQNGVKYGVALRAHNQFVPGPRVGACATPAAGVKPPPFVPPAPTNLTVTRGNGKLTVGWHHVPTALNYDVRYSTDGGQTWHYGALYYATTVILGGMDNTANYMVSVRGRNARGEGAWTTSGYIGLTAGNLARSPYIYNCPVASNRKCAAAFTTGSAANGYYLTTVTARFANQSDTYGQLGDVVVTLHAEDSGGGNINSGANSSSNSTFPADDVLATLSGSNPDAAGDYTYTCPSGGCALSANTTYYVQFAAASGNYTQAFYNLRTTAADADTLVPPGSGWSLANDMRTFDGTSWSTPGSGETGLLQIAALTKPALTAASITPTGATLSLVGYGVKWWYQANKAPDNTCRGPVRRSNTQAVSGLSASTSYTYTAYRAAGCASGDKLAEVTFTTVTPGPSLTASGISATGATLTIGGHSGDWYYQGISGTSASTSCVTVSGSTTDTLSTLTADNLYGYTAYSGANCTTEIDTEYFSTTDVDVGNLAETAASGSCLVGYSGGGSRKCAVAFTTGGRSGGYTLKNVTAQFKAKTEISGTLGSIIVAIHAADTTNSANPATTAKVTLTGNNPNTAGLYTYTCSGSDCSLSANTPYFIVMSTADTSGSKFYRMQITASDAEAVHPTGNGWSIANVGRSKNGSAAWADLASSQTGLLHVAADNAGAGGGSIGATATGPVLAWSNGQADTLRVPGWHVERDAAGVLRVSAGTNPAPAASAAATPAPGSRDAAHDVTTLAAAGNTAPDGLWANGAILWVVDADDRMLYAYDLASKARVPGRDVALSRNTHPLGLASDGITLWVSDYHDAQVYAYPVPGAASAPGPDVTLHPANPSPSALWTDGATLWVAEDSDGRLYAYTLSDGLRAPGKDLTLHADNASSGGLWSDGVTMWVSDPEDGRVYAYRLSDGRRDASREYTVSDDSARVYGLWSDGTTMWMADDGGDRVLGYRAW